MAHPLLQLLAVRPQLLADHAEAYGELAKAEFERIAAEWRQSALRGLVGLGALCVAAGLAGVALMLWASLPALNPAALWVLACVPLPPLALGGWCLFGPRPEQAGQAAFSSLRAQLRTDLQLLQWGGQA
jgi:hypothetical protein